MLYSWYTAKKNEGHNYVCNPTCSVGLKLRIATFEILHINIHVEIIIIMEKMVLKINIKG